VYLFEWRRLSGGIPGSMWVDARRALSSGPDREPQTAGERSSFAQTLLALARTLNSHVERYHGEVLPSILRALFQK
jgi:hypothetical protein